MFQRLGSGTLTASWGVLFALMMITGGRRDLIPPFFLFGNLAGIKCSGKFLSQTSKIPGVFSLPYHTARQSKGYCAAW